MQKLDEYKQHADECRQLANQSSNEQNRQQLLVMAERWEQMAKDRAKLLERQQRIADLEQGGI